MGQWHHLPLQLARDWCGRQVGVERKARERAKWLIGPGLFSPALQPQGLCKGDFCSLVSEHSACPVLGTLLVAALWGSAPPIHGYTLQGWDPKRKKP